MALRVTTPEFPRKPTAQELARQTQAPTTRTTLSTQPTTTQYQNQQVLQASGTTPVPTADERRQGALDPTPTVDLRNYLPQQQGTPQQRAQDAVDLEYDERIRALQWAAGSADRNMETSMDEQRNFANIVDPRLENIYGALGNTLGQIGQNNQAGMESALQRIRGFYDEAGQANQQLNTDLLARISGDAERWGVGAAIPAGTQGLNEEFGFAQSMNNTAKAGRSANLAQLMAEIGVLDNQRVGASQQEGAQERAMLQNQIAETLGQLGVAGYEEQGSYRNQIQGLNQDKAKAVRDAMAKMGQQDFENNITGRQAALDEFLSRAGLNMQEGQYRRDLYTDNRNFRRDAYESDRNYNREGTQWNAEFNRGNYESDRNYALARDQFGLDRSNTAFNQRMQTEQLNMERSRLQAELAQANSPEQRRLIQQEIQRNDAEIAKLQQEAGGQAGITSSGQVGLEQFFNSPRPEWGASAGPQFRQGVQELITMVTSGAMDPAMANMDPYMAAIAGVPQIAKQRNLDPNLLSQAVQIFFQGV